MHGVWGPSIVENTNEIPGKSYVIPHTDQYQIVIQ